MRIQIAEHVKRLGPHGWHRNRRFEALSSVVATGRFVLRFGNRECQERVYNLDAILSIKCGFDPILTLFRDAPYIRIGYTST